MGNVHITVTPFDCWSKSTSDLYYANLIRCINDEWNAFLGVDRLMFIQEFNEKYKTKIHWNSDTDHWDICMTEQEILLFDLRA